MPDTKKKNILLVDDEQQVREVVSRLLEKNDCRVITACDASEALEKLSNGVFDLVITDLKMPGEFSGIDLLKIIKAGFDTPVIVISGYGTLETALTAMRHGAVDFVPKPINYDYLTCLVKKTLEAPSKSEIGNPLGDMRFELKFELRGNEEPPAPLRELLMRMSPFLGLSDVKASSLWLAIKEAIRNAAVHGSGNDPEKTVTLLISNTSREMEVVVADQGNGFSLQDVSIKNDISDRHYLKGLNLIRNLADDMKFNQKGNEIMFVFLK